MRLKLPVQGGDFLFALESPLHGRAVPPRTVLVHDGIELVKNVATALDDGSSLRDDGVRDVACGIAVFGPVIVLDKTDGHVQLGQLPGGCAELAASLAYITDEVTDGARRFGDGTYETHASAGD